MDEKIIWFAYYKMDPIAFSIFLPELNEVFRYLKGNFNLVIEKSKKLIIAVKKYPYLYQGTDILQDTKHRNVFYTTPLVNCVYHCDYCFLQGMYPSANIIVFVNQIDMQDAVKSEIVKREYKTICITIWQE